MKLKITGWFCASICVLLFNTVDIKCMNETLEYISDALMDDPTFPIIMTKLNRRAEKLFDSIDDSNKAFIVHVINLNYRTNNFDALTVHYNLSKTFKKTEYFDTEKFFKKSLEFYTTNPECMPNKRIAYFQKLFLTQKLQEFYKHKRGCDVQFAWQ